MQQQPNIKPVYDYVLARKVEHDSGVITSSDVRDTHQLFEIVAMGEGRKNDKGELIEIPAKVGDKVWVQKHAAEGDTPKELEVKGLFLFLGSRIMAIEEDTNNG